MAEPLLMAVVGQLLKPLVRVFERELGRSLVTDIVVTPGDVPFVGSYGRIGEGATADGEARIRIRRAYPPGRSIALIYALYDPSVSTVGFSGFTIRGEVRVSDDGAPVVRRTSHVVIYNDSLGFPAVLL